MTGLDVGHCSRQSGEARSVRHASLTAREGNTESAHSTISCAAAAAFVVAADRAA